MGKFLKVMGVLCIIFGIIGVIGMISVFAMAGIIAMAGVAVPVASLVLGIIQAILMIVAGVFGIKASNDPAKPGKAVIFGIILIVLAVVFLILGLAEAGAAGISWTNFTGLIIPVLYLIAAIGFKKQG